MNHRSKLLILLLVVVVVLTAATSYSWLNHRSGRLVENRHASESARALSDHAPPRSSARNRPAPGAHNSSQPSSIQHAKILDQLVTNPSRKWSDADLEGAANWAKKNPDSIPIKARKSLILSIAKQDSALAFRLISELKMDPPFRLFTDIVVQSEEKSRARDFANLREHIESLPDEESRESAKKSVFSSLRYFCAGQDLEVSSKWLGFAELNPTELENVVFLISGGETISPPDQWIDWLSSQLPPESTERSIQSFIKNWTSNDYQAAGKWLVNTPDGPTKNAAVRAYAETVAKADPEVAKQWALTLPPGPEREETLQRIQAK